MEVELKRYENYSNYVKYFLIACGLWPNVPSLIKKFFCFINVFFMFGVLAAVLNFCFHNITNSKILVKTMGQTVSYCSTSLKVCMFLWNQDDLFYLDKYLSTKYKEDLENHDNRSYLLHRLSSVITFFNLHSKSLAATLIIFVIRPLFAFLRYNAFIRAYNCIYPFSYKPGGSVHWILYGFEIISGLSLWITTCAVDFAFGLYSLQICGELRLLAKRFESLHVTQDYERQLKDCIERHHLLINSKRCLENLYGVITIWIAISGALVLCSLMFQLSEAFKLNGSRGSMIHSCVYLVLKFVQIYMYAWYGNIIFEESTACLNSIYNSQWTSFCDSRFKNAILMVLTQKPLILNAKGFMYIQLDMFTKIANTSISYFFFTANVE